MENSRKQYVGKFVHATLSDPNKDALTTEFQSNTPYTLFSEESKHMIHTLANVGSFELCQISQKIQCPHCMKNLMEGIFYTLRVRNVLPGINY